MKMKQNETKNYNTNKKLGKQRRFITIQIKQYKVLNNHIIKKFVYKSFCTVFLIIKVYVLTEDVINFIPFIFISVYIYNIVN